MNNPRIKSRLHKKYFDIPKGPANRERRKIFRWYFGLHDRWSTEGLLGRQPIFGAIREVYNNPEIKS